MQLSDAVNRDGIIQAVDFLCGTTDRTYDRDDMKRNINNWYQIVQQLVLSSMDSWDNNQSIMNINLVAGTRDYAFPSDLLKIKKVQILFKNGSDQVYVDADPIDERNIDNSIVDESVIAATFTNTNPRYAVFQDSIRIYSGAISENVVAGIKVWTEDYNAALVADTDVPRIPDAFHEILVLGPSIDWSIKQDSPEFTRRLEKRLGNEFAPGQYAGLMGQLQEFYSNRLIDDKPKVSGKRERYD